MPVCSARAAARGLLVADGSGLIGRVLRAVGTLSGVKAGPA